MNSISKFRLMICLFSYLIIIVLVFLEKKIPDLVMYLFTGYRTEISFYNL